MYSNAELNRYFEDRVVPEREQTRRVIAKLKPDLDQLFKYIRQQDSRMCQEVVHVGSYYQGLKVRRSDEFDYNMCIDIDGPWQRVNGSGGVRYGFKGCDSDTERLAHTIPQDRGDGIETNLHITLKESLQLEEKPWCLSYPGEPYVTVSPGEEELKKFAGMTFAGDLVPREVKLQLKRILMQAVQLKSYFRGSFTSGFTAHGPALTLKYEHPDDSIGFPISVDISPVINTHYTPKDIGVTWPREPLSSISWPSPRVQRAVLSKPIYDVAKQNFYWMTSFAELEKELSKHADEDGGCRKQVHRLMKDFHKRFWRSDANQLSSYMIKNAWLWECETRPFGRHWASDMLKDRLYDCINRLIGFLEKKRLPLYFNPNVNLLKDKDEIDQDCMAIKKFLRELPALQ